MGLRGGFQGLRNTPRPQMYTTPVDLSSGMISHLD